MLLFYNDDVHLVVLSCCLNKWQAECCGTLAVLLELDYLPSSTRHCRTVTLNCAFYLIINHCFWSCSISSLICFSSFALPLYNCNRPASRPRIISCHLWVQQIVLGILTVPLLLVLFISRLKLWLVGFWHWPRTGAVPTGTGDLNSTWGHEDPEPAWPACGGSLQTAQQAQQWRYCELQNGNQFWYHTALPVFNRANIKCSGGCQPADVRWSHDFASWSRGTGIV